MSPPKDLSVSTAAAKAQLMLARADPAFFCANVLRDEVTGKRFEQVPMHSEWHALASESDRTVIWRHPEAGATSQLAVGRVLWTLGRDRSTRVAVVADSFGAAERITRQLVGYLGDKDVRRVFPKLTLEVTRGRTAFSVCRDVPSKDLSFQAVPIRGNIQGAVDLLVLDDPLSPANCRSREDREAVLRWYLGAVSGRLSEKGRVIASGKVLHPEDLLHQLAGMRGWSSRRFPVRDLEGASVWPSRWSEQRLVKAAEATTPAEFRRQFLCVASTDEELRDGAVTVVERWEGSDGNLLPLPDDGQADEGVLTVTIRRLEMEAPPPESAEAPFVIGAEAPPPVPGASPVRLVPEPLSDAEALAFADELDAGSEVL